MTRENPVNPSAYPISSKFVTVDYAGASSPTSAASAAVTSINIPGYSAELHLIADVPIYVSESPTMGSLYRLESGVEYIRGVGDMEYVYVKAVDANATIYFSFSLIK